MIALGRIGTVSVSGFVVVGHGRDDGPGGGDQRGGPDVGGDVAPT